jgi:Macrocin-O-methyltransferase (TylF)
MSHPDLYLDLLLSALSGDLSDSVLYRTQEITKDDFKGSVLISHEVCQELLKQADAEFSEYLIPQKTNTEEFLEMDSGKLFGYLNWMHPIASPHTMCGTRNLITVREAIEDVLKNEVPGDLIETGVWKGGMTVFMRGILKAYDCRNRKVWVADSFEGLPKPDPESNLKDALFWYLMGPLQQLAIPFEYVEALFKRYNLLDDQVQFLSGWFCDTLPKANIEKLAVIRMDGDLYESTRDALIHLYPKLSPGGYLIVDDYGVPCGCRQAVDEYRQEHDISAPLLPITEDSVYWKKPH